ncbi:uncharacterized protein LOC8034284 [Ixodes scapularis]|uniref:uncharacterized protein LOC8034284 n=1 Tax=Ixodes scapularis TaxID=6945 RepID=UPI001A9FE7F1|nr:uncharacterized protein LOC8034284 [Ixodes scapularis]
MHLVHRSVSRFLQDRVPDGFGLSLVALSQDRARPLSNLTRVAPDTRRALRALVPYDCSPGKGVHLLKGVRAAAKASAAERNGRTTVHHRQHGRRRKAHRKKAHRRKGQRKTSTRGEKLTGP